MASFPPAHVPAYYSPEWENLFPNGVFFFAPLTVHHADINKRNSNIAWEAVLFLKCPDVPKLMREGFDLTRARVCQGASSIGPYKPMDGLAECGWTLTRYYYLSDQIENPEWTARLVVHACDMKVLAQFRVSDLDKNMINNVSIWKTDSRGRVLEEWLYRFNRLKPEENINSIYDHMNLSGSWPWPR